MSFIFLSNHNWRTISWLRKWKGTLLLSLYTRNAAMLKYRNFLMLPDRLFTKFIESLKHVESVAKRRKHKPRSGTVRTPQFLNKVQDIIDEDPKVHKGQIERSQRFWVHDSSNCPWRHPVQVLRYALRSVYVCTNSRIAIHPGKTTFKQGKTFCSGFLTKITLTRIKK